jgi:hypothetical protein
MAIIALAATLAVSAYGFWSRHLWRQEIWQAPGGQPFVIFLTIACLWFGAWVLSRPSWLAPATFGLVVYSAAAVGLLAVLVVVFLLFSCLTVAR